MSEASPFDAMVGPILEGKAPRPVRLAASRGALPLPRPTLVRLYVALSDDDDDEIRSHAVASLEGLDKPAVIETLSDESCAAPVLDYFATRAVRDEELAERIAFHPAAPAAALEKLAAEGNGKIIELVLTNQQRLLAQPALLDRLTNNPALRADQRGRILELLERTVKAHEQASVSSEAGEASAEEIEAAARLLEVDVGELFAASEIMDGEEFAESDDPQIRTAYAKILSLNTAQRAILAMRGGREERMILVRDTNQVVALAVLKNGRITDDDVETISRLRNVPSEVLRQISLNRDWVKSYSVVLQLVRNPRTPQGVASNFVPRLHNHDLKRLLNNHDVPELIRRMARRAIEMRESRGRASIKKKH